MGQQLLHLVSYWLIRSFSALYLNKIRRRRCASFYTGLVAAADCHLPKRRKVTMTGALRYAMSAPIWRYKPG